MLINLSRAVRAVQALGRRGGTLLCLGEKLFAAMKEFCLKRAI